MIRIIGLGSPFGDDQVGWQVAEALRDRLSPSIDLLTLDRPGAALINWIQDVSHLVLIDACSSGAAPGSLFRLRPEDLREEHGRLSSHDLALKDTLRLAERLGCMPEHVDVYTIELGHHSGRTMSPATEAGVGELVSRILNDLRGKAAG